MRERARRQCSSLRWRRKPFLRRGKKVYIRKVYWQTRSTLHLKLPATMGTKFVCTVNIHVLCMCMYM